MSLSQEEIIRELKRYRYDHDTLRIPLKTLAQHVGLHRNTLNFYLSGEMGISKPAREKLSKAILDIRAGRLRFARIERVWFAVGEAVKGI